MWHFEFEVECQMKFVKHTHTIPYLLETPQEQSMLQVMQQDESPGRFLGVIGQYPSVSKSNQ